MQIFDTRIRALDYVAEEGSFYNPLRIERAVVPSGEYYIVTKDVSDIDDVYWTYEEGLDFVGANMRRVETSRLFESCENVVNGSQLEYHFEDLGEVDDDPYAFRVEWHVVYDFDQDDPFEDNLAGWCMTLHDVSS